MTDNSAPYFSLRIDNSRSSYNYGSPESYVIEQTGKIYVADSSLQEFGVEFSEDELDDEEEIEAATFGIRIVDVNTAVLNGYSLFDIFDTEASLFDFHPLYNTAQNSFNEELLDLAGFDFSYYAMNLLIIDVLEIYPRFRGNGFGSEFLDGLQRRFGSGCAMSALKAYPLQFCRVRKMEDTFNLTRAQATRKLFKYYKSQAFIQLPKNYSKSIGLDPAILIRNID